MQLLFAVAYLFLATADGFSPLQLTWGRRTAMPSKEGLYRSAEIALYSTVNNDNGEVQIANDFKMFLTQCSIQSFMFLIRSMRDPQTVMWLEEFTQPAIVQKETGFPDVVILEDSRMVDDAAAESTEDCGAVITLYVGALSAGSVAPSAATDALSAGLAAPSAATGAAITSYLDSLSRNSPTKASTPTSAAAVTSYLNTLSSKVIKAPSSPKAIASYLDAISSGNVSLSSTRAGARKTSYLDALSNRPTPVSGEAGVPSNTDMLNRAAPVSAGSQDYSDQASEEDDNCPTEEPRNIKEPRKSSKLLQYHGLAALNSTLFPTWNSYFEELLKQPSESFIVESSSSHIPDYEFDIDPSSLCSRIISVREQIAKEFVRDLQVIAEMGANTLEWYWENLRQKQGDNEASVTFQRENLMYLELNVDERSDLAPSPLRRGNFDLLVLLATQESIHRVLNDETRQNGPERATNEFLRAFYNDRMHYFHGPQKYGRADDFLEELLSTSPRMITVAEGATHLIDPTRIAEIILEEREDIALEWKELAAESPKEHMEIQRMRLNRMMRGNNEAEEESFQ